jgi:sugar phosphate isomerase/epimerase
MDRRGFLQTGAAALAAGALGDHALAQAPPAAAAQAAAATGKKLKVDAYSRHLQWLRSADEVAEATIEMAFDGVDITVRPYPGHVDPTKVATELPAFVKKIRNHGLEVSMITCPITDADSPNAEDILKAASSVGITHYWWGTFRYDAKQPVLSQLEALKPRVEKLVALNKKYNMKAMYHTYSSPGTIGENVWDFLYVLRNFDPAYVSFHWDVGHTSVTGGNGTWAQSLMAAAPYIGGVAVKEYTYELFLETPEGGPFVGTPADLQQRIGRPPAAGGPGGPVTPGAGAPAGRPVAPAVAPPSAQAAEQERAERGAGAPPAGAAPAAAAPRAGGRGPGGLGAPGAPGAGPGRAAAGRGGGGQPLPWRTKSVPLGSGINNLPLVGNILRDIKFDGPIEIQAEYPNGGAENAMDKITLPRAIVLGNMKRDLLTLKAAFQASGLL